MSLSSAAILMALPATTQAWAQDRHPGDRAAATAAAVEFAVERITSETARLEPGRVALARERFARDGVGGSPAGMHAAEHLDALASLLEVEVVERSAAIVCADRGSECRLVGPGMLVEVSEAILEGDVVRIDMEVAYMLADSGRPFHRTGWTLELTRDSEGDWVVRRILSTWTT